MIVPPSLPLNGTPVDDLAEELARAGDGNAFEGRPEYPDPDSPSDPPGKDTPSKLVIYTLGGLLKSFPKMREPVIDGLLRVGETMNVIGAPKTGKSWLAASLALAVVTGRDWLGFSTQPAGDVLIIDNELHPETLANRLRGVAEANGINLTVIAERITILPLRGRLTDLKALGPFFHDQVPSRFRLVIIDAFYRSLPLETDENDNAMIAGIYNAIDAYADHLRSSFVLIHHASKGNQSEKSVTDVGSGAGSQSRAADTHLILRQHHEEGVFVLDAAVRSFPPVRPRCLRWKWPSFTPAEGLDPTKLRKPRGGRQPSADKPSKPAAPPKATWDAKKFAETFGKSDPQSRASILAAAAEAGLSDRKAKVLLKAAIDREFLFSSREGGANTPTMIATSRPTEENQEKPTPTKKKNRSN